jgi:hypothetical protein
MQAERCAGSGLKTTLRICVNIRDMSDLKTLKPTWRPQVFTRFTDGITDMRRQKSGPATLCSLRNKRTFTT